MSATAKRYSTGFGPTASTSRSRASRRRATGWVERGGRPWLLREPGSGTRALNEQFLAERGLAPATLTLGSNGAIKQAARAGLGVSLLSRAAGAGELASGRLGEIRLKDGPPTRSWFVLRSAVGPVRSQVEEFISFARTAAARQPH